MRSSEELLIRFATDTDTLQVIALWKLCFPGEDAFREYFFREVYQPKYNLLLLKGQTVCAMLQMFPCHLEVSAHTISASYLYGVCTHPLYRRQHFISRLIQSSFIIDQDNGKKASVLIPQEQWLFDFYAKFGYRSEFWVTESEYDSFTDAQPLPIRIVTEQDLPEMNRLYHTLVGAQLHPQRSVEDWRRQLAMFQKTGGEVLCVSTGTELCGYAFVWKLPDHIWAQELFCFPEDTERWVSTLQLRYHCASCRISGLLGDRRSPIGCIRYHDQQTLSPGYMNLMMN